jgi:hypothetical protein
MRREGHERLKERDGSVIKGLVLHILAKRLNLTGATPHSPRFEPNTAGINTSIYRPA